ncbi:MAG: hypothetical protein FWF59_02240 [Turicibacter sp.]|nr:hypothetical protein [Turicibacter sp.]
MTIQDFMTPTEACHRWQIKPAALRWHLQNELKMEPYISKGWVKSFLKPTGERKEWIVSTWLMRELYGGEPEK